MASLDSRTLVLIWHGNDNPVGYKPCEVRHACNWKRAARATMTAASKRRGA